MADYPATIATFPTWVNGDDIDASNQNDPNDEITAIETGLLQGFAHNVYAPGFRYTDAASKTIASGIITITSGYIEVDTEGAAAADDLDTITIGVMSNGVAIGEGSIIVLQPASAARVVTVKTGTGNIQLLGGDYIMSSALSRVVLLYDGTNWVQISTARSIPAWTTPAYSAGDFTASSSTWTVAAGDVSTYAYLYDPYTHTMTVVIRLVTTSVGGTPTELRVAIPSSKVATKAMQTVGFCQDNGGTQEVITMGVAASGTYISLGRLSGNWSTATDATVVVGQITFQVN